MGIEKKIDIDVPADATDAQIAAAVDAAAADQLEKDLDDQLGF
ncbi:hypothetical protein [Rathayibacter sp. AY1C3]|nr:hypothetical protein [Rathayibacter sp. AY1C3]